MSMIGPTWLAWIFGVVMLAAASYAAARMVLAWSTHRATDYEVDGHHVLMGVAMAGMLIPGLGIVSTGAPATVWIIVWALVTVWFATSVTRTATDKSSASGLSGHHVPHLVMSASMVYMLAVMDAPTGTTGMADMSEMQGMSTTGLVPWPTLDALLLVFMAGYAVLALDRLPRAAVSGHRTHAGQQAPIPTHPVLEPRFSSMLNIVMAITMGYMLTMMLI